MGTAEEAGGGGEGAVAVEVEGAADALSKEELVTVEMEWEEGVCDVPRRGRRCFGLWVREKGG